MFRPNLDTFRGIFVMCCPIFYRKSVAPSNCNFRQRPELRKPVDKIRNLVEKTFIKKIVQHFHGRGWTSAEGYSYEFLISSVTNFGASGALVSTVEILVQ